MADTSSGTEIGISGSNLDSPLMKILMADDIQPGTFPSYQLCKTLYVSHPLGQKMAEAPIKVAQSQKRKVTVQDAPDEVLKEYLAEWIRIGADLSIKNTGALSRVYGITSIVMGCKGVKSDVPLNMEEIWQQELYFNVLDPLNTSGSMVLNQVPTSPNFQKPTQVMTNGEKFHGSRSQVLMNESPVYIEYTPSAFGYVGRSVYQRALYPMKSFIGTMVADDMIATKLGLLIAKMKAPGSIIDNIALKIAGIKRFVLRQGHTGNVMSIGHEEAIETLNMQNVEGAGGFARTNILKNIATAADMPAKLLENETMVSGFGEGTEDAKNNARYIDTIREWLHPLYVWFDNIVQYRAWNPEFYKRMQANYPERYAGVDYRDAFSEWRRNFAAEWPSLLIEPESEMIKVDAVKFETIIATVQTVLPLFDPKNKSIVIQWLADSISENKRLFPLALVLDIEELETFLLEERDRSNASQDAALEMPDGVEAKMGKFDSARPALRNLRRAVAMLPSRMADRSAATA